MNEIEIYMDHVIVFGQIVKRPDRVSREQWIIFWTIEEE